MSLSVCQLCAVDFSVRHVLTALCDGMSAEGWAVTCVCSDGPFVPRLRADGYRVKTLPIARRVDPVKHLISLLRMIRLFRREQFDLVHAHTPIAALLGRIAARIAGVPFVVYTAHGFYFHDCMHPLPKGAFTFLEWCGGRGTDLLFTQSSEDAATAVKRGFVPADRVIAIGNGVDPSRFTVGAAAVRARVRSSLGLPAAAIAIGMVGRMVAEKGYGEYFTAATTIAAARSDVYFVAVGERLPSDHAGRIDAALARARGALGDRLVLTGLRSDIPDLLGALDIFTLPSYREGMPRTIIEAMMAALPVVATDIRGSREEVVHGETGILVPVRDAGALTSALARLVEDPESRARMGTAGRARALALYDESTIVARQIAEIRARLPATLRARA